jgi:type II secretory pathway component PulJ
VTNNTIEAARQSIEELQRMIAFLNRAIRRSGMDLSPCRKCGKTVISIPDGLALCKDCAEKASE